MSDTIYDERINGMECCSSTHTALEFSQETGPAADRLSTLFVQTPEFQEFTRLAHLINLDPDVKQILLEIRRQQMLYAEPQEKSAETLQAELESLPAVQAYRSAEAAVKNLIRAVDQTISAAAGVEFAPNALRSGCG
jgi:cell fate (sporulation/competence/biofilm development) regulator YmcA (YheA/YmcA/DUF963 family)